ncbi:hypothetical protein BB559_001347 [Furculomyces boomerangus]|uniref:Probable quinone oxidoreductase n=2 Tax=Harpellales TaxID=61421 RepID=A0A2T9Z2C6_9FUNG|nr:hypothetical protein BB559_001347 [Furculomyces boomerangus]PWA01361.1 hypothetical protein BB558_002556 [Smittium angustum]
MSRLLKKVPNINIRGYSSLQNKMQAIQISKLGGIEVLENVTLPIPKPSPTQLLVKNEFAGVNFIDTYFRTGLYMPPLPTILGEEGAGTVVDIGSQVSDFEVGDRIAFMTSFQGYAEYATIDPKKAIKLPPNVPTDIGCATLIQGLTAYTLIERSYKVTKNDTVLIHAAAGGTGRLLVQLCRHIGATVIGTTSSEEKGKIALEDGCDHVINYSTEDVPSRIKELTNGKMVDVVFDGVGKATFWKSFDSLKYCGTLVSFGNASGKVEPIEINILSKKNLVLLRPTLHWYITTKEEFTNYSKKLFDLVQNGTLKVNISKIFDLKDAAQAHTFMESRLSTGKVLLRIGSHNQIKSKQ